jgi:hypothetical protein
VRSWIESPRKRRRLVWLGGLVVAAAVAVGVIFAIPSPKKENVNPTGAEGLAQTVPQTNLPLKPSDRHAIDAVLAKFIPAAVARRNADQAWAFAGPGLKAASTLAEWKKGNSPVPYYPVRERTFTGWPTKDVERKLVVLSLLVHPLPGSKLGDYTFSVTAVKPRSQWLIDQIYTIAINNPRARLAARGRAARLRCAQHWIELLVDEAAARQLVAAPDRRHPLARHRGPALARDRPVRQIAPPAPQARGDRAERAAAAPLDLHVELGLAAGCPAARRCRDATRA